MTATITRRELDGLIIARVETIGRPVHYAELVKTPPSVSAHDPRVAPYVVYWPDLGHPGFDDGNTELGDGHRDLVYTPQFTCVAGYPEACANLVDDLHAALHGWIPPVPAEWSASPMRVPPGYTTRLTREDDITPPRFSGFPQYQTVIST